MAKITTEEILQMGVQKLRRLPEKEARKYLSQVFRDKSRGHDLRSGAGFGLVDCGKQGLEVFKEGFSDINPVMKHACLNTAIDKQRSGADLSALKETIGKLVNDSYPPVKKNAQKFLAEVKK